MVWSIWRRSHHRPQELCQRARQGADVSHRREVHDRAATPTHRPTCGGGPGPDPLGATSPVRGQCARRLAHRRSHVALPSRSPLMPAVEATSVPRARCPPAPALQRHHGSARRIHRARVQNSTKRLPDRVLEPALSQKARPCLPVHPGPLPEACSAPAHADLDDGAQPGSAVAEASRLCPPTE